MAVDLAEARVDDEPILAELDPNALAALFQGIEAKIKTDGKSDAAGGAPNEIPPQVITRDDPQTSADKGPRSSGPNSAVLSLRKCSECGFPISEGRTLCLDCEKKLKAAGGPVPAGAAATAPVFFTMGAEGDDKKESWLARHRVLVAILVVVLLVLIGLIVVR